MNGPSREVASRASINPGAARIPQKQKARIAAGLLEYGARSWTRTNDPLINSQVL